MKQYPLSKGYKMAGILFGAAFFLGGLWSVSEFFGGESHDLKMRSLAAIIGIVLVLLGVWMFLLALRLSVAIGNDSLTVRQALTIRSIALKDIKGYRVRNWNHLVIAMAKGGRSLHLPAGLHRHAELVDWVMTSFPDLDEQEKAAQTDELLQDERFGVSRQARGAALETARKVGPIMNTIGIALSFWAIFYPKPYEVMMVLLFIAPMTGIFITWYYKGIMRLDARKNSPYPSVILLMIFPPFGGVVAVLDAYSIYDFSYQSWLILIGLAIPLTLAVLSVLRRAIAAEKKTILTVCVISAMALLYSWILIIYSNCRYDRPDAKVYPVYILRKEVSSSSTSTSYLLELTHWGKYPDGNDVEVGKSLYDAVSTQNTVCVLLFKGRWGIPWYTVVRCE